MQCLQTAVVRQNGRLMAIQCTLARGHPGLHVHSQKLTFDSDGTVFVDGQPAPQVQAPVAVVGFARWTVIKPDGSVTLVLDETPQGAKEFAEGEAAKGSATISGDWARSGDDWELTTSIGKYVVTPGGAF